MPRALRCAAAPNVPVPTPSSKLEASAKLTVMKGLFRFLADLEFQYLLFREPKRPKGLFGNNHPLARQHFYLSRQLLFILFRSSQSLLFSISLLNLCSISFYCCEAFCAAYCVAYCEAFCAAFCGNLLRSPLSKPILKTDWTATADFFYHSSATDFNLGFLSTFRFLI